LGKLIQLNERYNRLAAETSKSVSLSVGGKTVTLLEPGSITTNLVSSTPTNISQHENYQKDYITMTSSNTAAVAAAALLDPTSHLMPAYPSTATAAYSGYSWPTASGSPWWATDTSSQAAAAWLSGYGTAAASATLSTDPTMAYNPYLSSAFAAIPSPGKTS
jgi:hypothetical protein